MGCRSIHLYTTFFQIPVTCKAFLVIPYLPVMISTLKTKKTKWDDALSNSTSFKWSTIAWKYRSDEELGSHRTQGVHALYGGGGYVANLGYEAKTARRILNDITKKGWIDRQTRVVMVELSTFNVATKLLTVTTLYFEMLPSDIWGHPREPK